MRNTNILAIAPITLLFGCGPPIDRDQKEIDTWCNPDPKSVYCEQARWRVAQCKANPDGLQCLEAKALKKRQSEAAEAWEKMKEELDQE
jgi:hypothetical protein